MTTKQYAEKRNPLGYYEADPKPSREELNKHYADRYYQEDHAQYAHEYPDDEVRYFFNIAKAALATSTRLGLDHSLLDLGCGEGFFAKAFHDSGWGVACCDFSQFGISHHNPDLLPFFEAGDIHHMLGFYKDKAATFGLVNLQNVLEHVLDPETLLNEIKPLVARNGALRIRVPNDYSEFQLALVAKGCTTNTWFVPPEHLSYFNNDSLTAIMQSSGYRILSLQADFPIELFLANPHSNYWHDRTLGKGAHMTRVFCENHLIEKNVDDYVSYSEAAAKLGFGSELIVYATVA